jgi:GntR family transcriptional regulator
MWQIDKFARIPIYEQVVAQVERYVMQGVLKKDEPLPSVRTLSQEMSINPNTLQKAYAELERRGVCYAVPGSGRFVRAEARERLIGQQKARLCELFALARELRAAGVGIDEMIDCIRAASDSEGSEAK